MRIKILKNKSRVDEVVTVHMQSFPGFFLTFLGNGFLKELYKGFVEHNKSDLIVAVNDSNKIVGFLAYSKDLSGFYRYLIKRHILSLGWYAGCAFLKNPKIAFRLFGAFTYSEKAKKKEQYIELSSIGVLPDVKGQGIGSKMVYALKRLFHYEKCEYIKLETDAKNNESANFFYQKNGFILHHRYQTREGRNMNEYRYYGD